MNHGSIFRRLLGASAIAVLVIASFGVRNIGDDTRITRAYQDLYDLAPRFAEYRSRSGHLPTTEEGFGPLIERPAGETGKWTRAMDLVPIDPWGNRYQYRRSIRNGIEVPEVVCAGKDGMIGTEDDLSSLDPK